mgnify:CR=1 FL=1
MIEVSHLSKSYGSRPAVQDLSFTVPDGQIYGLLGPNGAGKSTIMNILTGYLAPTEGEVKVAGFRLPEQAQQAKACVGYLPEQPPLHFSVPASSAGPAGTGSLEYIARQRLLCICPPSLRPPATS